MMGVRGGVEFIVFDIGWGIVDIVVLFVGLVMRVVIYCVGVGEFMWWFIRGELGFGIDCINLDFIVVVGVGSSRVVGGGGWIVRVVLLFDIVDG